MAITTEHPAWKRLQRIWDDIGDCAYRLSTVRAAGQLRKADERTIDGVEGRLGKIQEALATVEHDFRDEGLVK